MYSIANVDLVLEKIGLNNEIIQSIVAESVFSGIPYVEICRKCCSDYYVCVLTKVLPVDVEEYSVFATGVVIEVDKNKVVDKTIEELLSKSSTVKYHGNKVFFYIPVDYMLYIYNKLCRECSDENYEIKVVDEENTLVYLGEEYDSF